MTCRAICLALCLLLTITHTASAADPASITAGSHERTANKPTDDGKARLTIHVVDDDTDTPLPVRAIVTASDGSHPDGSSRGVYKDGRFFADGSFTVDTPPGRTTIELRSGPDYVPLTFTLDTFAGRHFTHRAKLHRWFNAASLGWHAGDNHVHAQHDAHAHVRTDLAYTALQGRANGLSFITESGSSVSYDMLGKLDTPNFLLRYAPEIRPGPYVGHLNTPGLRELIPDDELKSLMRRPLPAQAVCDAVRKRGGVVIHTHPMTPPHQLHWMGATEALSDAVHQRCTDLFDVDTQHSQTLWFAMLNLGNRVAVSSYTDAALGRANTLSPGDRRVYCYVNPAERDNRPDYRAFVDAMRAGRTCATNGGPTFGLLDVEGAGPGDTLQRAPADTVRVSLTTHTLHPLRNAAIYMRGRRVAAFNTQAKRGANTFSADVTLPDDRRAWIVARCEDDRGNWWLSSPVYVEPPADDAERLDDAERDDPAAATLLEISNATRFAQLRPEFFAHVIVTVRPNDQLTRVELLKDGRPLRTWTPADGDHLPDGLVPVTDPRGLYATGWTWFPDTHSPSHFQADFPVTDTGWYAVRSTTRAGRTRLSDAMHYLADNPNSQTLSVAHLTGADTRLTLHGYAEEVPLAQLKPPYAQGGWWYPQRGWWRMTTDFADHQVTHGHRDNRDPPLFRSAP